MAIVLMLLARFAIIKRIKLEKSRSAR